MEIKKIKIENLNLAEYNPRVNLKETDDIYKKIKASIEEFGYVEPLIVNTKNNTIIGGHQRLNVLKDLGYDEVECVLLDIDIKAEKKLNLALNKITGIWDTEKLNELFNELDLTEEELLATGFDEVEIENLNTDFISDLLDDDFIDSSKQLDKFSITFNIDMNYKDKFDLYIKENGKDELVNCLINCVEEKENA